MASSFPSRKCKWGPEMRGRVRAAIAIVGLVGAALVVASASPSADRAGSPNAATAPPNPKLDAAMRNTPPPAQTPSRAWSARTPAEVLANLPSDPNFQSAIARLSSGVEPDPRAVGRTPSVGAPIYVRGLRAGDANEYLVPVNVGDTTIALMKIGLDAGGLGRLDAVRGWSTTSSFPATSEAAAIVRGSTTNDAVIQAEFVWTNIRGSANELQPFWRLTRSSGAMVLLLEDGSLISAAEVGL